MIVITISKKMLAAFTAGIAAIVLTTVVVSACSSGAGSKDAAAPSDAPSAATNSTTSSTTTPSTTVAPTATTIACAPTTNGSRATTVTTPPVGPDDPTAGLSPFAAAAYRTLAARRLAYSATLTVDDTSAIALGALDLDTDGTRLLALAGGAHTEFRRIGDSVFIDAAGLGSPGSTWVALDGTTPFEMIPFRTTQSFIDSLSPQRLLTALDVASNVTFVGDDADGAHYRATIDSPEVVGGPLSALFIGALPIDGTTSLDVWLDSIGRIGRIATSSGSISSAFTLSGFGGSIDVPTPAPTATSGLDSVSGRFVFGTGQQISSTLAPTEAVSIAPTVEFVDGVVRGNLNATSAANEELRVEFDGASNGGRLDFGTIPDGENGAGPQGFTALPYANWLDGAAKGIETFGVTVRETTELDRYLSGLPLLGTVAAPSIDLLQDSPDLGPALASLIGSSESTDIDIDIAALAPGDTPIAHTYDVVSFDGTMIATNFFPASGMTAGQQANTVLLGAGLGRPGATNPYALDGDSPAVPGIGSLRNSLTIGSPALDVITWDPRGSYRSGGVMQFDSQFFEARDVAAIVTWAANSTPATLNGPNDPALGMLGGSYGGDIALISAGIDPRIDAIVPSMTWNSIDSALQYGGALDTDAADRILDALSTPEIRLAEPLRRGLEAGIASGHLSDETLAAFASSDAPTGQLQAPALLFQSTTDPIAPAREALTTAERIVANPFGTPVKLAFFDGTSANPAVRQMLYTHAIAWIDKFVAGVPIPDAFFPDLQWWDQTGARSTSDLFPFEPGFNSNTPISASSSGGNLTIAPFASGAPTSIEIHVDVPPAAQIVGAPTITFTYSGSGSATSVFVEVSDASGRSTITPVPVTLDGRTHTVSMALDELTYTEDGAGLTVTILSAASAFHSPGTGTIAISSVQFAAPARN